MRTMLYKPWFDPDDDFNFTAFYRNVAPHTPALSLPRSHQTHVIHRQEYSHARVFFTDEVKVFKADCIFPMYEAVLTQKNLSGLPFGENPIAAIFEGGFFFIRVQGPILLLHLVPFESPIGASKAWL